MPAILLQFFTVYLLLTLLFLSLRNILNTIRPSICGLFIVVYASTPCRTSGSMIRHLLYVDKLFTNFVRSLHMYCTLGSAPANLYFQIRYFMYMFISMYSTVASIEPSSLPNKNSVLSTITFLPQYNWYTPCTVPYSDTVPKDVRSIFIWYHQPIPLYIR